MRNAVLPERDASRALSQRPWMGLLIAAVVIGLDQWTKQIAVTALEFRNPERVTSWFDWMLTYNTGAAFSFLANAGGWQRWFLSGVAGCVSVAILVWLFRLDVKDRGLVIPMGLILGGGVGNLIDRVQLGHVVDFISLHYQHWYWPAFNLADSAITVGFTWWLLLTFFSKTSQSEEATVS